MQLFASFVVFGGCDSGRVRTPAPNFFRPDSGSTQTVWDGGSTGDAGDRPAPRVLARFVVDGDTIILSATADVLAPDGKPLSGETVRMLGLDAPEIAHPNATPPTTSPDCWGDEAHTEARDLMQGLNVTLDFASSDLRDQFGRLLAYVVLADGRVANEVLIRQGHAKHFGRYRHRDYDAYERLEQLARTEGLGVWTCR